ncbi:MAG: hypothetical protein ACR2OX_08630, partial [Methyloligellaceae bacterium]
LPELAQSWTRKNTAAPNPSPAVALRKGANDVDERIGRMAQDIGTIKQQMAGISADVTQIRAVQVETDERVAKLEGRPTVSKNETPEPAVVQSAQVRTSDASGSAIEGTTLDGVTRTTEPLTQPVSQTPPGNDEAVLAALLGKPAQVTRSTEVPTTTLPVSAQPTPQAVEAAKPTAEEPRKVAALVPIPARRTFGVELASGDSVDSLRLSWALLNERHRDLLGRLAPRYVLSGASGSPNPFRLIAGPFSSSHRARELCTRLQAYYVSCKASAFTGSVL